MCSDGCVALGSVKFISRIGNVRTAPKLFVYAVRVQGEITVP